ncbi:S-layer homology domain-containing protein [Microbacterium sp. A93]|uniref:S-layer homology domain-containing protein n=1 Tax=Microbacterium sp. A93 TaxID=3450716 RepID=UPI003F434FD9
MHLRAHPPHRPVRRVGLGLLAAAVLVGTVAVTPAGATTPVATAQDATAVTATQSTQSSGSGFRVLPYIMEPSDESADLVWFSETEEPGTVVVRYPGEDSPDMTLTSEPEHQPLLGYTEAELAQDIDGLEQGSWLKGADNYKHRVTIPNLEPGLTVDYAVTQGSQTHESTVTTGPGADWDELRIVAFSDTETEPYGRTEHREWEQSPVNGYTEDSLDRPGEGSAWDEKFGHATRYGAFTLNYPLDQDTALQENLKHIEAAEPDLMLVAGDLAQGGGYQPGWDEFFGYFAGEHGDLASRVPLLTALGNWETFASINGGYGTAEDQSPAVISRNKYHSYFERTGAGADPENAQYRGSYYRTDYGPVTILSLDSTNGLPDEDTRTGELSGEVFSGDDSNLTDENLSTDTQGMFTMETYTEAFKDVFPGSNDEDVDLPNFNEGTEQWAWAEEQLADARERDQVVLVQFHHAAYSNGVHGTPPNHEHPDNQSGTAMRAYTPMFEDYGVSAVISGHDEMFERSWVDADGDGQGFHSFDVGVAADGLRGEQLAQNEDGVYEPLRFNSSSEWTAAADEPETWVERDGVLQLEDGGLHYGHLQIDLKHVAEGTEVTLTPVYVFPELDSEYNLVGTERRVYDDVVTFTTDRDGADAPAPAPEDFSDNLPGSVYYAPVRWMQTEGVTTGYADGTYRKGQEITRGESVAFLQRYLAPDYTADPAVAVFPDVPVGAPHFTPIAWAADDAHEVTTGYTDGTFRPGRDVTRSEFVTFLYRAAGPEDFTAPKESAFEDVPTSSTHYEAIAWAASEGLVNGYTDGDYRPFTPINRGEVAKVMYQYDLTTTD